jgi:internalin A
MGLENLPDISKLCPFATALDISNNIIAALPSHLTKLPHVSILDISTNQLSTLPDFLSALACLTDLRASDNNIRSLPNSLVLPHLTSLTMCRNYLDHAFPPLLCESFQSSLKVLRLSNNGLNHHTAPASIRLLTALVELDLGVNCVGGDTLYVA